MNILNILRNALNEEKLPEGKTGILLLDIDDTLLKSDSSLLKIYRKLPTDKEEVPLTSAEYAKEHVTPETKKYYDYRDFRDPKKVYASIANGAPLLNNLKVVDAFYNGGYDLGILTARGCADAVRKAIRAFLKVRDKDGNLVPVRIVPANIHCVNDDDYPYPGATDFEKKQNVLKKYAKEYNYDYVYFIDDDPKNINALKALKKADPEIAKRLRSIDAKKNMAKPVNEETLSETKRRSASDEMLMAANDGDYKKVITIYFNENKDSNKYAGKKDAASVLKLMINHGIPRFFIVREKSGEILEGVTQKIKNWGLAHINELVNELEYSGNPDYVAPKKSLRKKFMAVRLEDLEAMIQEAKEKGYVFKDTPKEGHTAKDGDFYYIYGSIKNVNEESGLTLQALLTEMASKDVTPEIRKAIAQGDYKKALIDYFNKVKGGKAYEKYGDDLGAIYDQVRSYGMMRAFGAEERAGNVPEGTKDVLRKVAENNRDEILASLGFDSKAPTLKEKKAAERNKPKTIAAPVEDSVKIEKRIADYAKLVQDLEDYGLTGASIKPFIVDIKRNGKDGIDRYAVKQKLTDIDFDAPDATENERRMAPMLEFRKKNIPDFIQKKALKEVDGEWKKNLDKAETLGGLYYEATKNKIFADYMARYLNNIVEGYKDFKRLNKDASLDELKTGVDFPYDKFVELEKWYKSNKLKSDEEDFNSGKRKRADVKIPEEIYKVRQEYITFLNELDKAIAEGKLVEFFSSPNNYSTAYAAVNEVPVTINIGLKDGVPEKGEYPSSVASFPQKMKEWAHSREKFSIKLSPRLKKIFRDRAEESKEPEFSQRYSKLAGTINGLYQNILNSKGNKEELEKIYPKLEKCSEEIINVMMDRIIALEMVVSGFNSGILGDVKVAAKRYEKIKEAKLKEHPELKFNPDNEKYKKYYVPGADVDDMYKAIAASLDKMPFAELVQRRLVPVKGVNIAQKRYTDDEVKELYNALQQGDDKLYELLATDKFRTRRESK